MVRELVFYEHYFFDFYEQQSEKVKEKIDYVFDLVANAERIPEKFLKHLEGTNGLYEIRVKFSSDIFRIFCFFHEGKIVVVLHGFQKKSEKIPKSELVRAEKLKQQYIEENQYE